MVRLKIDKGGFRDGGIDLSAEIIFVEPPLTASHDSGQLQPGEAVSPPGIDIGKEIGDLRFVPSAKKTPAALQGLSQAKPAHKAA